MQRRIVQNSFHNEIGVSSISRANIMVKSTEEWVMVPASPTGRTSTQNEAPNVDMDMRQDTKIDIPCRVNTEQSSSNLGSLCYLLAFG